MEKKLFGTDGIRGRAGEPPLDPDTIFAAGFCLGQYLGEKNKQPKVILGEDPRESSRWITDTLVGGLRRAAVQTLPVGIITTPGLAFLTISEGFDAGVMVSASHNPYQDNGIKVFASTGYKLPDADELELEQRMLEELARGVRSPGPCDSGPFPTDALVSKYVESLHTAVKRFSWGLPGRKLVLDCANGSASACARQAFSDLGLELVLLSDRPDGTNINHGCGSLHLEHLREAVFREKADLGVAFDGDADRALFVTASGKIVDGDGILLLASRYLRRRGMLKGEAVIGTVMANLGLEKVLAQEGLKLVRTPVGDKYVLEEMLRTGANLGGEQSGHIIFSDLSRTGDGLLTALQVLRIMAEEGRSLEQLVEGLQVFPQTIRNIRVREKVPLENLPRVQDQIQASQRSLGNSGRVLVRYSGTELLARVMVEAESAEEVERQASALTGAIEETIGLSPSQTH